MAPGRSSDVVRVALLADLFEPVSPAATTEVGVVVQETASALRSWSDESAAVVIDLFARRGSAVGLPLVSVDPEEVGPIDDSALSWFAIHETVYAQLFAARLLDGYDVVHVMAPVVSLLPLLARTGAVIVQTLLVAPPHPARWLPRRLLSDSVVRRISLVPVDDEPDTSVVELGIDLSRFAPAPGATPAHLVWDGTGGPAGASWSAAIGDRLGLPVRSMQDGDGQGLLRDAVALLHLADLKSPCGAPWAVRALACGTPVVGWVGAIDPLVGDPEMGVVAPVGDWRLLADGIRSLPDRATAYRRRREAVLAQHGRTAMLARYRAIYRELLDTTTH